MRYLYTSITLVLLSFCAVFSQNQKTDPEWYALSPVEARLFTFFLFFIIVIGIAWFTLTRKD